MSYQVLARKWRPQNFKEMVGQEHVLKALIHALDQQRLHHAYLFTGTRGVGKTTIGRILAKCLNCETKITSEPCGHCDTCREITEGRFVDLIEIDAASRTKVEDMRELLENVQYAPTRGRFKVYLIDEVHMLSQSSFNALLKTLEEPPEHVKFLFATTDPQKLPVTILSRCLQFNLKNMAPERIVGHLKNVLTQEHMQFEDSALWLLARAADGSMRDALSLTDQAIAYGNRVLGEGEVSAMLGSIDQKQVYRIIEAVANQDARAVLQEVSALADFSPDYSSVLANIISVLHRVAIEQVVPGSIDNSIGDRKQIIDLAAALSAEDVQLFYQVGLVGRKDLAIAPDQRAGVEMALLRMLAFQPDIKKDMPKLKLSVSTPELPVSTPQMPVSAPEIHEESAPQSIAPAELSQTSSNVVADPPPPQSVDAVQSPIDSVASQPAVINDPTPKVEVEPVVPVDESSMQAPAGYDDLQPPIEHYDEAYLQSQAGSGVESYQKGAATNHLGTAQKKTAENPELATKQVEQGKPEDVEPEVVELNEVQQVDGHAQSVEPNNIPPDSMIKESEASDAGAFAKEDLSQYLTMDNPWPVVLPQLQLTGMTQNLASNTGVKLSDSGAQVTASQGHFRLLTDTHKTRIIEAFKRLFGDSFHVEIVMGDLDVETPAEWRERKKIERLDIAIKAIEGDQNVQALVNKFDATILKPTVEPID